MNQKKDIRDTLMYSNFASSIIVDVSAINNSPKYMVDHMSADTMVSKKKHIDISETPSPQNHDDVRCGDDTVGYKKDNTSVWPCEYLVHISHYISPIMYTI